MVVHDISTVKVVQTILTNIITVQVVHDISTVQVLRDISTDEDIDEDIDTYDNVNDDTSEIQGFVYHFKNYE